MGQGSTIIIDLLYKPMNVFLLMTLTYVLSLVLSHYPDYLEKNINTNDSMSIPGEDKGVLSWEMSYKIGCFGIISYKEKNNLEEQAKIEGISKAEDSLVLPEGKKKIKEEKKEQSMVFIRYNFFKRVQSIFLFWAIVYVLTYTYKVHINPNLSLGWFNSIYLVLCISFYYLVYKLRMIDKYKKNLHFFGIAFFWVSILLAVLCVVFSAIYQWHPLTYFMLIAYFSCCIISYSFFCNLRVSNKNYSFTKPLFFLANNKNYLIFMSVFGWICILLFMLCQIKIFLFNPVIIIIALLFSVYGLIINPIKHKLYYSYLFKNNLPYKGCGIVKYASLWVVPISLIFVIAIVGVSVKYGNGLHTLHLVKETSVINESAFKEKLYTHFSKDTTQPIYFIASYGGGLTANTWNSLIFKKLSNYNGANILKNTIAMSGVSGGAMGQGIYSAIYKNNADENKRDSLINNIGNKNFISLDIAWMFGWDFLREFAIGVDSLSPNRAKRSMCEYEALVADKTMSKKSFRSYWKELFDANDFYPALLINTASTHSTRGISCSVDLGENFRTAFPGAEDILTHTKNNTLSYSDALSTTNRFPLLSPAAKISSFGHYVDGGYFENSGMLSLYNFYQYLASDPKWEQLFKNRKIIFIQIMNSKSDLIFDLTANETDIVKETQESGEFAAVLNTIISIDKFPRYTYSLLKSKKNLKYASIALPYHLSEQDFNNVFKAKELNLDLTEILLSHNHHLDSLRTKAGIWETAEPPLARLLSKPALNYMNMILADKKIFNNLDTARLN